jgi:hypothetical protein
LAFGVKLLRKTPCLLVIQRAAKETKEVLMTVRLERQHLAFPWVFDGMLPMKPRNIAVPLYSSSWHGPPQKSIMHGPMLKYRQPGAAVVPTACKQLITRQVD